MANASKFPSYRQFVHVDFEFVNPSALLASYFAIFFSCPASLMKVSFFIDPRVMSLSGDGYAQ
jgi:hypothetical protein